MLFSATQTRNVKDLAKLSLKKKPHEVHVDFHQVVATAEGLEQVCIRWVGSDSRVGMMVHFVPESIWFHSCSS